MMIFVKLVKFLNFFLSFLYYFFLFIIFYFIFLNICNYFSPKYTHKFMFFNICYVSSGSMSPDINKNDLVIVKKLTDKELQNLKEKDCVVFYVDKQFRTNEILRRNPFVLHEIQANNKEDKFITTKGKANKEILDFEKKISYEDVLYKVVTKIPLSKIIDSKKTKVLSVISPFLIIIFLIFKGFDIFKFLKSKYFKFLFFYK